MGEYGWKFSDRLPLNGVGVGEYGWKFSDKLPLNGLGWVNVDGTLVILPLNGVSECEV